MCDGHAAPRFLTPTMLVTAIATAVALSAAGCGEPAPSGSRTSNSLASQGEGASQEEGGEFTSPPSQGGGRGRVNADPQPSSSPSLIRTEVPATLPQPLPEREGSSTADPQSADRVRNSELAIRNPGTDLPPTSWASFRNGDRQLGIAAGPLPEILELLWKLRTEYGVTATAAIVADRVYVGTIGGELLCLDRDSGAQVWTYRSIESDDPTEFAPAFKAAPRVTAGMVYVGDEDGVFHAVDRATGRKRWTFATEAEIAGCAAVVDDRVIIGSYDSFLYCLKADDGTLDWKFQTDDRINCSTAVAEDYTFVAGCDSHLRVIDIRKGEQKSDIPLDNFLIASPAVPDDVLYVGTYGSEVVAVDWKNEKILWRYSDPEREFPYHSSAAVTDDAVIIGSRDKRVHCIDRKTGARRWVFGTGAKVDSSPVVAGDRVFFGSSDRSVYAVGLADGKERWKFNAGGDVTAGPAVGEGVLVVGVEGSGGNIFCFGKKE